MPVNITLTVSSGSGSGTYSAGTYVNISAYGVTGYSFTHWHYNQCAIVNQYAASTQVYLNTTYGYNATASAQYTINVTNLAYVAGAGGSITGNTSQSGNYGSSGTSVTAVPSAGYHFLNWSDSGTNAARTDTFPPSGTSTYTANFELDPPTTGYYNFGNVSAVTFSTLSKISICAWVYTSTWGDASISRIINDFLYSNNSGWQLGLDDGTPTKAVTFSAGWSTALGAWHADNAFDLDAWYHICVTYDRAATTNDPVIYSNAVSKTVHEDTTPSGTIKSDSTNVLYVGRMQTGASTYEYLDGYIRDLRIYNRILSAVEVAEIYNSRNMTNNAYGLVFAPVMYGAKGLQTFDGASLAATNLIVDPFSGKEGEPGGTAEGWGERLVHNGQ